VLKTTKYSKDTEAARLFRSANLE